MARRILPGMTFGVTVSPAMEFMLLVLKLMSLAMKKPSAEPTGQAGSGGTETRVRPA
jgi:hypothetical protein